MCMDCMHAVQTAAQVGHPYWQLISLKIGAAWGWILRKLPDSKAEKELALIREAAQDETSASRAVSPDQREQEERRPSSISARSRA